MQIAIGRLARAATRRRHAKIEVFAGLGLITAALLAVPPAPAEAACGGVLTRSFEGSQIQLDNCPGNGAPSWGWIYASPDSASSTLYVQLVNGGTGTLSAGKGQTNTTGWSADVVSFRVCNLYSTGTNPPAWTQLCS